MQLLPSVAVPGVAASVEPEPYLERVKGSKTAVTADDAAITVGHL